jgi:hypothetical protein
MSKELKHPLQALLITRDSHEDVIAERKKISIREGHRDYREGLPFVLCCPDTSFCVKADLISVRHCLASQVNEKEWKDDGYSSLSEMISDLRKYYPYLTTKSPVTVLRWNNVRGYLVNKRKN